MSWNGYCCNCGTEMMMSQALYERRTKDKRDFFCPNGHEQHFTGKSKDEKRIDELEVEKLRLERDIAALNRTVRQGLDRKFKCPIAYCKRSEKHKHLLRFHLEIVHGAKFKNRLLPEDAGASAHGDMGIN